MSRRTQHKWGEGKLCHWNSYQVRLEELPVSSGFKPFQANSCHCLKAFFWFPVHSFTGSLLFLGFQLQEHQFHAWSSLFYIFKKHSAAHTTDKGSGCRSFLWHSTCEVSHHHRRSFPLCRQFVVSNQAFQILQPEWIWQLQLVSIGRDLSRRLPHNSWASWGSWFSMLRSFRPGLMPAREELFFRLLHDLPGALPGTHSDHYCT